MIVNGALDTFERKTFRVKAIRVTAKNMREIADWTGGEIIDKPNRANYVMFLCGAKREPRTAYAGDWVTSLMGDEGNFRVYNNHTFLQAFQKIVNEAEKYAKVHELLLKVARAQDSATFFGDASGDVVLLIEKTARDICNIG